ncbi:MAG: autotransporter-associated beta strand repeat-containing protein [Verrucomicrobiota bacterium]
MKKIPLKSPCLSLFASAALLLGSSLLAGAETWNLATGGTWNNAINWNPQSIPNATGANATFNNSSPAQTANRSITVDAAQTVGSITLNNDAANTFTTSLTTGTTGSLILDEVNAGPATINVPAVVGTGNFTISAPITLTDSVVGNVDNVTATSQSGALNLTAVISGTGGFTKAGDGVATFGTGIKTYSGATVVNGGRLRSSLLASPTNTSSFTINAGGQLTLITAASFTFGSGPLNLNGNGPIPPAAYSIFPGAIRNNTDLVATINNLTVLQSDTVLAVQGLLGSLTFTNTISGPGKLTLTPSTHDANLGTLVLSANNTYQGGTVVDGGTLVVSNASATLGTGNVTVNSANLVFGGSSAKLTISTGVTNAIADTATLTLAGGRAAGTADDGFVELQTGVNEVVAGLVLAGAPQAPGIYGSTTSSAPPANQNDEFFAGPGIVTVGASSVAPTLTIARSGSNVIISWPTSATGFTLQELAAFPATPPPFGWTDVTTPVVVSGSENTVTVAASGSTMFFRLRKPN